MHVIDFFKSTEKDHWLDELSKCDWGAGKFLHALLKEGGFFDAVGQNSTVLLLVEDTELVSFCTYAEKDDIQPTDLTPWMGFIYTFPVHRGKRYAGLLFDAAVELAKADGVKEIYISTNHTGLYEKYGCTFSGILQDMDGEDSRIYVKKVL